MIAAVAGHLSVLCTVHVERLLNGDQIGVDSCALYISTIAPADFEVERVVK
jgi:hypothetical protein